MNHSIKRISKSLLASLAVIFFYTNVHATQVPVEEAQALAKTVFAMKADVKLKSAQEISIAETFVKEDFGEPSYYIFNIEPTGFVIISAEDRYNAVLAYSDESRINFENAQAKESLLASLGAHEIKIQTIREQGLLPPGYVKQEWNLIRTESPETFLSKDPDGVVIPALTTTLWDQGQYYNAWTPALPGSPIDGRTYCGCAPIALAQLIKYHNYPPQGNGNVEYEDPQFGTLTGDFCNTTYDWDAMPDKLEDYNDDVAEFIYHCGVSTYSSFSAVYTATFNSYIRDALVDFFNFDESANWFVDENNRFAEVAIEDLNQGRPVYLTGLSPFGTGHSWVADGYGYFLDPGPGQPDEYFHFNWGWGGDNNGWFLENGMAWIPEESQTDLRAINFFEDRIVVHNVFPSEAECASPTQFRTSGINEDSGWIYADGIAEGTELVFRFRKRGTGPWTESPVRTQYYFRATNLDGGTEYEYQVKKKCCGSKWSDYSVSTYFETPGSPGNPCETFYNSNLKTSNITENNVYVYTSQPYGDVENQFRYRFVGSFLWSYTDIADGYFRWLENLEPGTNYEFQVRHRCDFGQWTDFSESDFFTTAGTTGCADVFDLELFTSSTTESASYIYTSQPYGRVDNQFRYRVAGNTDWNESDVSDKYYRYLRGLEAGTEYEFQVNHRCDGTNWTGWSFTRSFNTLGGTTSCDNVSGDRLYYNSITDQNAYIYTPQPFGLSANQFRYKETSASNWSVTTINTQYYRYLRNLETSSAYEFQVRHECSPGLWTNWSTSQTFTTLSGFAGGHIQKRLLPQISNEDVQFREMTLDVFPNPAKELLNVAMSNLNEKATLKIFNVEGRLLIERSLTEVQEQITLDVSDLLSGVYLMHLESNEEVTTQRFVKE